MCANCRVDHQDLWYDLEQKRMTSDAASKRYRNTPVSRDPSQMFVGASISTQLRNSSYGRFHDYLSQSGLQAQLQHEFQLPCVIVVGGRSAGKSSLLEAITKCPIFPTHRDLCTKMPIELHMQNDPTATERRVSISYPGRNTTQLQTAPHILEEVSAIMQSVDVVTSIPIVIEICQADVPTFTFVDLPGIQTYPEEQEKATTDLVNAYLNRPNTLVLCVVDATTAAFDTSVALKLIRDAGKLSNTIVALTKSDLVTEEEEYVPKILDRILGESSDNEHLKELAGCVAVANRQERSKMAEADAAERKVFSKMLHNPAEAFAPPEIQKHLKENMTTLQLIVQLDCMFHSYIVQHWKPAALHKLEKLQQTAQKRLTGLGPPVEELTADAIMAVVLSQVHIQDLCKVVKAALLQSTKHSCASDARLAGLLQDHSWGSLQWVNTMNAVDSMADKLMGHCALASSTVLLNTLRACFTEIFNKNPHPKVKRFTELQSVLADAVLPQYIARLMSGIQPKLQRMADITIAGLYSSWNPETKARIKNLDGTLQGCVLSHFVGAIGIIKQQPSGFQLPQDFVLVEDIDVQQQRKALCDEIARLNFATMNISLHVM